MKNLLALLLMVFACNFAICQSKTTANTKSDNCIVSLNGNPLAGSMTIDSIIRAGGIHLSCTAYKITSFEIVVNTGDLYETFRSLDANFTPNMIDGMKKCKKGTDLSVENIKVTTSSGEEKTLKGFKIRVK